jgi:drug/metabolite transporter (DMT)-like permease
VIHLLALAGVLSISFSAIFVKLASVSPATATLFRAAYAVPVLAVVSAFERPAGRRAGRERLLAFISGLILAADLTLWHESIALIGAALGTIIPNVQVVFVALGSWALYRERPAARTGTVIAVLLCGVALTSGFARAGAYGSDPVLGAVLGVLAGVIYAAFLLAFRAANASLAPTAGPLLDSTLGTLLGGLLCAPFDPHFALMTTWPAHLWLGLLALVSQVIGWLLIATALPRLPAVETSIMLLGQPIFAVIWGVLFFDERLSGIQWMGSALVLAGVATLSVPKPETRPSSSRQTHLT